MLTILWDNDGVLVDIEELYFLACQEVLGSVGIDLTLDQFKDLSLRRGESTFTLASGQGIDADTVSRLRRERDRIYAELLELRCPVMEDSERGLAAATAAGVDCIIVLSEWTKGGDFTKAMTVVENISGVPEEVLRRANRGCKPLEPREKKLGNKLANAPAGSASPEGNWVRLYI